MDIRIPGEPIRRIGNRDHNKFIANGANQHRATSVAPLSFFSPLSAKQVEVNRQRQVDVERELVSFLGKPRFSGPGFILYQRDCTDVMNAIATSRIRFDLTVTSPPYNIGKEYESVRSVDSFIDWCAGWMEQIYALTNDQGTFWHNLGYFEVPNKGLCVPIPYLLWDKSSFYMIQEVVWKYGAGVTAKRRLAPRNEKWLYYVKNPEKYVFNLDEIRDPNVKYPNQKKNGKFRCNPLGKNPSDVWEFPKVTTGSNRSSKERTGHPAQFPLGIVERVIRASSNTGDLVFDPFAGSCSTGIGAVAFGRIFLGCELRDNYCEIAIERFKAFYKEKSEYNSRDLLLNFPD